jgi:hypothetical protein
VPIDGHDLDALADALVARLAGRLHAGQHRLLNRSQLAERLGISERGVTSLTRRGELPVGYLIGGVRRWRWEDVLKYLAGRKNRRPRRGRGIYDRDIARGHPGQGEQKE